MQISVKELPEGYCQISCGRCKCCSTVLEVLEAKGFHELSAVVRIVGIESVLASPGFETTMLAPSDTAMQLAYAELGATSHAHHFTCFLLFISSYCWSLAIVQSCSDHRTLFVRTQDNVKANLDAQLQLDLRKKKGKWNSEKKGFAGYIML
jgi:hypothetical protein